MTQAPARWLVILAFAAIYIIWGSTYLAIHFAVETISPSLMSGVRFILGAVLLIGWSRLRGEPLPKWIHWRSAFVVGVVLFVLNNGGIVWAEWQGVPTGIVALLVATTPMWIVVLRIREGQRPTRGIIVGILLGLVGIALLMGPGTLTSTGSNNLIAMVVVLLGALCWAWGVLYSRTAPIPRSAVLFTGMQLLCGGIMQLIIAAATGEFASFDASTVTELSVVSMLYLAIVSSTFTFSAYIWLNRVVAPEKVATYAYVNPVIAVFLGWALADEPVTPMTLVAAAIIIVGVVMITGGYKGGRVRRVRLPLVRRVAHGAKAA